MREPTNSPLVISPDEDDLRLMVRKSGLTARELAVRIGVTESALSKWVRGRRTPLEIRVEALAQALGKTPAQIRRAFLVSQVRFSSLLPDDAGTSRRRRRSRVA